MNDQTRQTLGDASQLLGSAVALLEGLADDPAADLLKSERQALRRLAGDPLDQALSGLAALRWEGAQRPPRRKRSAPPAAPIS